MVSAGDKSQRGNKSQKRGDKSRQPILSIRAPKCFKIAIVYNVYRIVVNINVCMESALLEFNVPIICLGTEGVSPHREGRYFISDSFIILRQRGSLSYLNQQ